MPTSYPEVYARWLGTPERFWAEAAEAVHWYRTWDVVLDDSRPPTDARPKVILSASCGIEIDRIVPYKPLLDRRRRRVSDPADHRRSGDPGRDHGRPGRHRIPSAPWRARGRHE